VDARSGASGRGGPGARILAPTAEGIALAAAALARGEPVGMPTETVYGLAAPCWDERAVARVFAAKDRPRFDPLIVHVAEGVRSVAALAELGLVDAAALGAAGIGAADALCGAFWPGPLTLVLPKTARVPDIVTAGLATVAVRAPRHPVAQALIAAAGVPLAAPSANRFGRISPTRAEDVAAELGDRIGLVLDGGPCAVGVESTVVEIDPVGRATVLRPGGIGREELESVLGGPAGERRSVGPVVTSPGQLESHYAPRTPVLLGGLPPRSRAQAPGPAARFGALVFGGAVPPGAAAVEVLGTDPVEAARHLFAALRELDEAGLDAIVAEPFPSEDGLGHAINDRLRRAAAR
jgi:L-threonylcarbamoyladenylate synthase